MNHVNTIAVSVTTVLLLLCAASTSVGESTTDLREGYNQIRRARDVVSMDNRTRPPGTVREVSPAAFVANSLITGYQTVISSQDNHVCNFSPSCSHFATEAISRAGFVRGCLLAADRLLRCHPYAIRMYAVDRETGKAIDRIERYIRKQ